MKEPIRNRRSKNVFIVRRCTRIQNASMVAAMIYLVVTATPADAQSGNPGPTINVHDLGDLGIGGPPLDSGNMHIEAGTFMWFGFQLTTPITPTENWLDIDTAGAGVIESNVLALYDSNQNRIAANDDSGGGTSAAMSFGAGSGLRLTLPSAGGISMGQHGFTLPAGKYWAGIGFGPDTSIFPDPNPNWVTTSTTTRTGSIRIKLTTGSKSSSYWNESHHGGEAGNMPETSQVVEGSGTVNTIVTGFDTREQRVFKIRICDPTSFEVTTDISSTTDGSFASRLYLFDTSGQGVIGIAGTAAHTTLTPSPGTVQVGNYYLAISSKCPGENGFEGVPYDVDGNPLWIFATPNTVVAPDGPGATNRVAYWGRLSNCENDRDFYRARLSLTGACHVPVQTSCPVDFNGDDRNDLADFKEFLNCFDGP